MIAALRRAEEKHAASPGIRPFVLIGHSKQYDYVEFTAEYGRGPEADVVDAIASARWVTGVKRP